MFFDHYPYTNFHNVNLDWVLQAVKAWGRTVEANDQAFQDLEAANESFKSYVRNYLQDLDITDEINTKLDAMLASGVLTPYFAPYVQGYVNSWLNSHVTPTSPALDNTLTLSGAAARADATGKRLKDLAYINALSTPEVIAALNRSQVLPGYRVQGITYDYDGHYYVCGGSVDEDGTGVIVKMTKPDFSDAEITVIQQLGHANDITYYDGYLYVCSVGGGDAPQWGIWKINVNDFTDKTLISNAPENTIGIAYRQGDFWILAPYRIYRTTDFTSYEVVVANTNDLLTAYGIPTSGRISQTLFRTAGYLIGWVCSFVFEERHYGAITFFSSTGEPVAFKMFPAYHSEIQGAVYADMSIYLLADGNMVNVFRMDPRHLSYVQLKAGDDLNSFTGRGTLYSTGSNVSSELVNSPSAGEGFTVQVERLGVYNTIQTARTNSGRELYRVKSFSAGTWGEWIEPAAEVAEIKEDLSALNLSVEMGIFGYSSYLGNAITLQFNDGTVMMIDSFSENAWSGVKSDLTARGITHLDYFMLTHWHGDHTGNIVNLITDGYIDADTTIYLPQDLDVDATGSLPSDWTAVVNNFRNVLPRITALDGTIIYPTEGQEVNIGGCRLRFWNADHSVFYPGGAYASTNYNDWSLCAYLFIGNTNVCFTADIGPIGQQKMVDLNTMVKANLYTATHHGWDNGNASNYFGLLPDWINRLNPDIVFSEDYSIHNQYILTPSSPMQSWCERNCVPNYRTAINGTMTVYVTSDGWSFGGAYSKYIREYDWGFDYHKKRLLARIDALKAGLLKDRYTATTDTYSFDRLLKDAVTAMRGADYLNDYKYSFYIRIVDSDNADAYLEIIASNFQYTVNGPVITTRYANVIRYNTGNPQGTITIVGRTGTATVIVEMLSYEEVTG